MNKKRKLNTSLQNSLQQKFSWNLPLQFSLQYLIGFIIGSAHTVCLQYFFEITYLKTCYHYIDIVTNKKRRSCPLVTYIDTLTSIIIRVTFILLLFFWIELVYNAIHFKNIKKCKYFERILRRIYWCLFGFYLFILTIGFIILTFLKQNLSYFLTVAMLFLDFGIPISFLIFGFKSLNILKRKMNIPNLIIKHLRIVCLISLILGFYLSIRPIIRIIILIVNNIVIASDGYNYISSIIKVISEILFYFIPAIVTFAIVIAPTSINFLHNKIMDRNNNKKTKRKFWKKKWKETNSMNNNNNYNNDNIYNNDDNNNDYNNNNHLQEEGEYQLNLSPHPYYYNVNNNISSSINNSFNNDYNNDYNNNGSESINHSHYYVNNMVDDMIVDKDYNNYNNNNETL
ncbi:hypothetical protein ABK040_010470 [Willaertia magna]